jgi:hypothetical protein
MAKKNGQQVSDQPEIIQPDQPAIADLHERHSTLRDERRALERELGAIDGKLRAAIDNGDLALLESLSARKSELPKLFIAASMAESTVRHEIFNAEDSANLKRLEAAELLRDKLKAAFEDRQREVELELATMKAEIQVAEQVLGQAYAAITGSRELGASGDAGFKKSLASLGIG